MKTWLAIILITLQVLTQPACVWAFDAGNAEQTKLKRPLLTGKSMQIAKSETKNDAKSQAFIDELMSRMTIEEKIGQMNLVSIGYDVTGPVVSQGVDEKIRKGLVGGVFNTLTPKAIRKLQDLAVKESRLKIPLMFGYDVIHGHRTIFPINLGLSSSWDLDLIERTASAAADEASADGLNWTFSPMVDITRDPRWGRVSEGSGEDLYLGSRIAEAMVRGYQGDDHRRTDKVLACVKHFALYGAAEAGRDYNTVDMSPVRMFNEYLEPYKAAVNAGVETVMTSFNEINGIPATANKWLVTELLREKWGFKGFVSTDYTAVNEMINHGVGDEAKVAELAINAGIDQDMVGELFLKYGSELVKAGRVSEKKINEACRRILQSKFELGLFDDPYRFISEKRCDEAMMTREKLDLSKEAGIKSMVLLKNAGDVLPLKPQQKIAFIGPLVKDKRNLIGSWSAAGDWQKAISIWESLEAKFGVGKFLYAKGCNLLEDTALIEKLNRDGGMLTRDDKTPEQMIQEAVKATEQSDIVVAVLGEPFIMCGEAASRSNIGLFDQQIDLLKALKKTGKPIALVLMNGRPLTLSWEDSNIDAILETWFAGTRAGDAIVDVLFGDANPSGKLTMSFPQNVGQIPIYYNAKPTGRPYDPKEKYKSKYLDVTNAPLYPFGHGLSYTQFEYGDVNLNKPSLRGGETLTISVAVKNIGKRAGVETAQLYVHDEIGSITRPIKELKRFQKVSLNAGESKTITFSLTAEDLKFYNSELEHVVEPGDFKIYCGTNSDATKEARFTFIQ